VAAIVRLSDAIGFEECPMRKTDKAMGAQSQEVDAYIPVRAPGEPETNGYVTVYLPNGTALVVNGRDLLRLDPDLHDAKTALS
jgi:hypothetical protein